MIYQLALIYGLATSDLAGSRLLANGDRKRDRGRRTHTRTYIHIQLGKVENLFHSKHLFLPTVVTNPETPQSATAPRKV